MKVIILGAGVIGVSTAYFLSKAGHEVVVIDREKGSAMECSFANGGQLSYSHAEPWANPSAVRKIMKWIWQKDAPLQLRPNLDPYMWSWALKFLKNCKKELSHYNNANILRLDFYSRKIMHEFVKETPLEFNYLKRGKMHIFKDRKDFDAGVAHAKWQENFGDFAEVLTPEQCSQKEPALKAAQDKIVGGIFSPDEESGDIHLFTTKLEQESTAKGVKFLFNTEIKSLHVDGDRILGVETDKGIMKGDAYVMALGAFSSIYLRKIGIKVPIYPMKGYSISIPLDEKSIAPEVSVTDHGEKLVYSKLGNVLRVAGTAEFDGYNIKITPRRIKLLKRLAGELFPHCGDVESATSWACLRPSTPDGPPIIGESKYKNLFFNTGHGTLGWTQAMGSARIVSDIVDDKKPEIELTGLTIERYL